MASVQEMRTEMAALQRQIGEEREKASKDKRHDEVEEARSASVDARLKAKGLAEKHPGHKAAHAKADALRDRRRTMRLELDKPIMPLRERLHVLRRAIKATEIADAVKDTEKLTDDDLMAQRAALSTAIRSAKAKLRVIAAAEDQRAAKREAEARLAKMTPSERLAMAAAVGKAQ
jgi:hypothetical protein